MHLFSNNVDGLNGLFENESILGWVTKNNLVLNVSETKCVVFPLKSCIKARKLITYFHERQLCRVVFYAKTPPSSISLWPPFFDPILWQMFKNKHKKLQTFWIYKFTFIKFMSLFNDVVK